MPICCGKEMRNIGCWFHCLKCGLKLIQVKDDKTKPIVQELLSEIVRDYEMKWKELQSIIHEIWVENYYENGIGNIPDDCKQS